MTFEGLYASDIYLANDDVKADKASVGQARLAVVAYSTLCQCMSLSMRPFLRKIMKQALRQNPTIHMPITCYTTAPLYNIIIIFDIVGITVVTPPVVFNCFPLSVTHLTIVEPSRERCRVASLLFCDCTAVVLRRHGGYGGGTAVLVWCHCGHDGAAAIHLRIGPTRGGTAEVLNMFKVSAVQPRRSVVLTVFHGATEINDGTTAVPRRSWRCHW